MNTKDRLYNLIHSMSPNEKGYFKKFVASDQGEKSKKYLQVFELFDKQKAYSKTDLEKKFEKKGIGGDLNSIRNYLYKLVLKSLRSFSEKKSVMVDLYTHLQNANILDQHGLHEQAIDQIHNATDKADELGNYGLVMDMMTEEMEILKRLHGKDKVYNRMLQLIEAYPKYLQLLDTSFEMHDLFCKIQMIDGRFTSDRLSKKDPEELKQLVLENRKKCTTNATMIQSLRLDVQLYNQQLDLKRFGLAMNKIDELYNKSVLLSKRRRDLELYAEVMDVGLSMNSFVPAKEDTEKVEALRKHVLSKRRSTISYEYYNTLLLVHILLLKIYFGQPDQFEKLSKYKHEIEKNIERVKSCILQEHNLNILLSIMTSYYFVNQEYEKSLSKAESILQAENVSFIIYLPIKFLYVMNHYELGNVLYLESAVRSFYRNRERKDKYTKTEGIFLRFFRKLLSAPDKNSKESLFVSLRDELTQLSIESPKEKVFIKDPLLIKWLTAKIENKPLLEVLKEKRN